MAMTGLQLANHPLWSKVSLGAGCRITDMVRLRGRFDMLHIEDAVWLMDFVSLTMEAPLRIGKSARLMPGVIVTAHKPVTICAGAKIAGNVQILAGMHCPHDVASGGFITGHVTVGTGAVIGPNAVIGPGVTIEQNGRIQANSVIGIDWNGSATSEPRARASAG